jgi:hypothetical protein
MSSSSMNSSGNKYGFKEEAAAAQQADRYGTIGSLASTDQAGAAAPPAGPVLPPKIDRQKKPHKKSASERLFGGRSQQQTPPDEEPPSPVAAAVSGGGGGYAAGSLNQAASSNSYDPAVNGNPSLGGYDSYNKRQEMPGYSSVNGPAAGGGGGGSSLPYNRSLSQPPQTAIQTNGSLQANNHHSNGGGYQSVNGHGTANGHPYSSSQSYPGYASGAAYPGNSSQQQPPYQMQNGGGLNNGYASTGKGSSGGPPTNSNAQDKFRLDSILVFRLLYYFLSFFVVFPFASLLCCLPYSKWKDCAEMGVQRQNLHKERRWRYTDSEKV